MLRIPTRSTLPAIGALVFASTAAVAIPTYASTIFNENFNDGTLAPYTSSVGGNSGAVAVVTDGANLFGEGTSNQVAQLFSGAGGGRGASITYQFGSTVNGGNDADATEIGTYRFEHVRTGGTGFFNALITTGAFNATNSVFVNTVIPSTALAQTLDILFNNSTMSQVYDSPLGQQTLLAGTYDVWTDGTFLIVDGATSSGSGVSTGAALRAVQITNGTANGTTILVDNSLLLDELTLIPEPGSLALLGLGGIAMLGRRRQ